MTEIFNIDIDPNSRIPKYKQIVDSIINDVSTGRLTYGEKIPSINELSENLFLSRDTVEKAYRMLKEKQVITSVKGKGYYTSKTDLISKVNVLLLVNKPSNYKMMIYNAFVNTLGVNGHVNMYIYHCDELLFTKQLEKNLGAYDYYVIMPHFRDENYEHKSFPTEALKLLEKIPKEKLLILDNENPDFKGDFSAIYQDFENDIYNALTEGLEKIRKYDKVILTYPSRAVFPYPKRIVFGFKKFCIEHSLDFEIIDEIYEDMEFRKKDLFITIRERDLIDLIKQIREQNLELAKDVGVISYNDTPLKELLGISVISTDFKAMGETAAYMILKNKKEKIKNVFNFIDRNSL